MNAEDAMQILISALNSSHRNFRHQSQAKFDYEEALDMAIAALRAKQDVENPKPLTLGELKAYLSSGDPYETAPLYIVFDPPMPVDYSPRWRDASNLSKLVASDSENYGKTWMVYHHKPKEV